MLYSKYETQEEKDNYVAGIMDERRRGSLSKVTVSVLKYGLLIGDGHGSSHI
jgi:hypothetical protein